MNTQTIRTGSFDVIIFLVLCCCIANAQQLGTLETAKFDSWPGKASSLKAGFEFDERDYSKLASFESQKDRITVKSGSEAKRRIELFSPTNGKLEIVIGVCADTCGAAQRSLLQQREFQSARGFAHTFSRSKGSNAVGDVAFRRSAPGAISFIGFVRNNIFVLLTSSASRDAQADFRGTLSIEDRVKIKELLDQIPKVKLSDAELFALAKAIDEKIVAQADCTEQEVASSSPKFARSEESAAPKLMLPLRGGPVRHKLDPITVAATDPVGGEVMIISSDSNTRYFEQNGEIQLEIHARKPQMWRSQFYAVSSCLLVSTKEIEVELTQSDQGRSDGAEDVLTSAERKEVIQNAIRSGIPGNRIRDLLNEAADEKLQRRANRDNGSNENEIN